MKKTLLSFIATAILLGAAQHASAHIGYGGRNFGTLEVGGGAVVINNQTISSSFGWADATDSDWGDSHKGRFFRFTLNSTASVIITVARNSGGNQTVGNGTADSFLPGVSLYSGLAQGANNEGVQQGETFRNEGLAYDSTALSVSSRPEDTEGSFRALSDWSIGNDPTYNTEGDSESGILIEARLASFTYIGHAVDGTPANYGDASEIQGDGTADGFLTATFLDLPPGDYSFFVGGADYAAQTVQVASPYPTYGVYVSAQAIAATPTPVDPTPAPTPVDPTPAPAPVGGASTGGGGSSSSQVQKKAKNGSSAKKSVGSKKSSATKSSGGKKSGGKKSKKK